jgi:hypothetical protein
MTMFRGSRSSLVGRKAACALLGLVFVLAAHAAAAQDICTIVSKLLTDPPAGFIAERAAPMEPRRWAGKPVLPHGDCVVWASDSAEAHDLRCFVNNRAAATEVNAFYTSAEQSISQCLTARDDHASFARTTKQIKDYGLTGVETTWINESDKARWKIGLSDFRRDADGSAYNNFYVEYLKY